ncbi:cytochrome P450 [Kitasatospora kazusensis]|uniref:Cytochrome P450 n=1 Tax=Kitasatospora kazusensis TaxID=407974 RepID=A0ABN2ZK54_9ACTN
MDAPQTGAVTGRFDLADPARFADDGYLAELDRLREDDPVSRHPEADGPGFWVVTRHADVCQVYSNDSLFSSNRGMRLGGDPDAVRAVADRMLIVSDPPRHQRIRRLVGSAFTPRAMRALESSIRTVVGELMDTALESGSCEFVSTVARPLPTDLVCAYMGLPRADWRTVGELTTEGIDSEDEDDRFAANTELFLYFSRVIEQRRRQPGEDMISSMLAAADEAAGPEPFSDVDLVMNFVGILIGANETTRYTVAGGLVALTEHPAQWQALQRDAGLVDTAVDEILRWVAPAVHALRTVTSDTELHGHTLAAGDRVTVWTAAANRDPRVFEQPERFDLARTPNRQLSFGYGRHVCVGARLARMQIAAFVEELRTRVGAIELDGPVAWNPSNFTRGPIRLPVRLSAR